MGQAPPYNPIMTDDPDLPPPKRKVDPEDIRKALDEQAKKRPPRPPVSDLGPQIPKLKVNKPRFRKHKP